MGGGMYLLQSYKINYKKRKTLSTKRYIILGECTAMYCTQSLVKGKILMQGELFQRCTHFCNAVYCLWAEK